MLFGDEKKTTSCELLQSRVRCMPALVPANPAMAFRCTRPHPDASGQRVGIDGEVGSGHERPAPDEGRQPIGGHVGAESCHVVHHLGDLEPPPMAAPFEHFHVHCVPDTRPEHARQGTTQGDTGGRGLVGGCIEAGDVAQRRVAHHPADGRGAVAVSVTDPDGNVARRFHASDTRQDGQRVEHVRPAGFGEDHRHVGARRHLEEHGAHPVDRVEAERPGHDDGGAETDAERAQYGPERLVCEAPSDHPPDGGTEPNRHVVVHPAG